MKATGPKRKMALLTTGGHNPPHPGHLVMLQEAKAYFEAQGFEVEIHASPSQDSYLETKKREGRFPGVKIAEATYPRPLLNSEQRNKLWEAMLKDNPEFRQRDVVDTDESKGKIANTPPHPYTEHWDVMAAFATKIQKKSPGTTCVYVTGEDLAKGCLEIWTSPAYKGPEGAGKMNFICFGRGEGHAGAVDEVQRANLKTKITNAKSEFHAFESADENEYKNMSSTKIMSGDVSQLKLLGFNYLTTLVDIVRNDRKIDNNYKKSLAEQVAKALAEMDHLDTDQKQTIAKQLRKINPDLTIEIRPPVSAAAAASPLSSAGSSPASSAGSSPTDSPRLLAHDYEYISDFLLGGYKINHQKLANKGDWSTIFTQGDNKWEVGIRFSTNNFALAYTDQATRKGWHIELENGIPVFYKKENIGGQSRISGKMNDEEIRSLINSLPNSPIEKIIRRDNVLHLGQTISSSAAAAAAASTSVSTIASAPVMPSSEKLPSPEALGLGKPPLPPSASTWPASPVVPSKLQRAVRQISESDRQIAKQAAVSAPAPTTALRSAAPVAIPAVGRFAKYKGINGALVGGIGSEGMQAYLAKQLLQQLNPTPDWATANVTRLQTPLNSQTGSIAISTQDNKTKAVFGSGTITGTRAKLAELADSARIVTSSNLLPAKLFLRIQNELRSEIKAQDKRTLKEILGGKFENWKRDFATLGFQSAEQFERAANIRLMDLSSNICHSQKIHFLVEEQNVGGEARNKIRDGLNLDTAMPNVLLSTAGLNFANSGLVLEGNETLAKLLITNMWQGVLDSAVTQGCNHLVIPAIGLGAFLPNSWPDNKKSQVANLYYESLMELLSQDAYKDKFTNVLINPVFPFAAQELDKAKKKFADSGSASVRNTQKFDGDVKFLAVKLANLGEKCALVNPSDADALWAKYDIGMYFKNGHYVAEEDIAATSTAALGSVSMSDVYTNPNKVRDVALPQVVQSLLLTSDKPPVSAAMSASHASRIVPLYRGEISAAAAAAAPASQSGPASSGSESRTPKKPGTSKGQ